MKTAFKPKAIFNYFTVFIVNSVRRAGGGVGILLTCLILNNLSNVHTPLFAFRFPCLQFERSTSLIDFLSYGTQGIFLKIYIIKTFAMQLVDDSSGIPLIVT